MTYIHEGEVVVIMAFDGWPEHLFEVRRLRQRLLDHRTARGGLRSGRDTTQPRGATRWHNGYAKQLRLGFHGPVTLGQRLGRNSLDKVSEPSLMVINVVVGGVSRLGW